MIIDWHKEGDWSNRSLLGWAIVESMKPEIMGAEGFDASKLDVRMSINGVDVDPTRIFANLAKQLDNLIADKAKELLEERFKETTDVLDRVLKEAKRKIGGPDDED